MLSMKKLLIILIPFILASCGDDTRSRKVSSSSNTASPLTNTQCSQAYDPVCGQPPMPLCPPGIFCAMVMPAPVVYDNQCLMEKAGAAFIKKGACQ